MGTNIFPKHGQFESVRAGVRKGSQINGYKINTTAVINIDLLSRQDLSAF